MFIILTDVADGKIRINVSMIVYYLTVKDEEKECTEIKTIHSLTWVSETPEEIDTLIEEALEQMVTNVDNLLGISSLNYQYSRT